MITDDIKASATQNLDYYGLKQRKNGASNCAQNY
jgi:hypothetical protein